jgi:NifB/MoaA-like Fe-S oxidoreductase
MKKYILMSAGYAEWRIDGVYDSMEQLVEVFKKDYGCDDITIDDIENMDFLREIEMKIEEADYYPATK